VAAAGLGAGAGEALGVSPISSSNRSPAAYLANAGAGMASDIANAATRSLINGSDFGDNIIAALPDTIGQTIGNMIADGVAARSTSTATPGSSMAAGSTDQTAQLTPDNIAAHMQALQPALGNSFGVDADSGSLFTPEDRIDVAEAAGDISAEDAVVLQAQVTDLKKQLRADYLAQQSVSEDSYGGVGSDGLPYLPAAVDNFAIDMDTINARQQTYDSQYQAGVDSLDGLTEAHKRYDYNRDLVRGWDQIANAQLDQDFKDFGKLYAEQAFYMAAGEGAGFLVGKGVGLAAPYVGRALGNVLNWGTDAAETAVPQVTANRLAGNLFRDEIAGLLKAEGRDVSTEVYKSTPFGKRFIDIEVSKDGQVLGGIETKFGGSRYTPAQRAKDWWLKANDGYIVNVVRNK